MKKSNNIVTNMEVSTKILVTIVDLLSIEPWVTNVELR